jgi:hypothetical protein
MQHGLSFLFRSGGEGWFWIGMGSGSGSGLGFRGVANVRYSLVSMECMRRRGAGCVILGPKLHAREGMVEALS